MAGILLATSASQNDLKNFRRGYMTTPPTMPSPTPNPSLRSLRRRTERRGKRSKPLDCIPQSATPYDLNHFTEQPNERETVPNGFVRSPERKTVQYGPNDELEHDYTKTESPERTRTNRTRRRKERPSSATATAASRGALRATIANVDSGFTKNSYRHPKQPGEHRTSKRHIAKRHITLEMACTKMTINGVNAELEIRYNDGQKEYSNRELEAARSLLLLRA